MVCHDFSNMATACLLKLSYKITKGMMSGIKSIKNIKIHIVSWLCQLSNRPLKMRKNILTHRERSLLQDRDTDTEQKVPILNTGLCN